VKAIWKFPLQLTNRQTIAMPPSAEVLCVQPQNGRPCLWALVHDIDVPAYDRTFSMYVTGEIWGAITGEYVGTFQLNGGELVFHIFEEAK
jgi:hypothetical protein